MSKWKILAWPFTALVAALAFFLRGRSSNKGQIQEVQAEATAAKADAVNAKAELVKEKIKHETEQDLAAAADLGDSDIINAAIEEYRASGFGRSPGGAGVQGSESDG